MRSLAIITEIECRLDDEYFVDWEALPDELKEFWEDNICNCEGEGNMGLWCQGCSFCQRFNTEEES